MIDPWRNNACTAYTFNLFGSIYWALSGMYDNLLNVRTKTENFCNTYDETKYRTAKFPLLEGPVFAFPIAISLKDIPGSSEIKGEFKYILGKAFLFSGFLCKWVQVLHMIKEREYSFCY